MTTEPRLQHALNEIASTYGATCTIKPKSLLKFGKATVSNSVYETVQNQGSNETYQTGNTINSVISSDNGDDQTITVEGHTISGTELTFVTQTIALTGQTAATLTTPLARATRAYNSDSTEFSGTVYVCRSDTYTDGVPDTAAKIHLQAPASDQQSLKASTSISKDDYWVITQFFGSVDKKTAATVTFRVQVKGAGGVFRTQLTGSTGAGSPPAFVTVNPPFIVPANADVRIQALSSSTNTDVSAWMNGHLALASS